MIRTKYISAILLLFVLSACSNAKLTEEDLSKEDLMLPAGTEYIASPDGETLSIEVVSSSASKWSATSLKNWMTVSTDGGKLTVTVAKNNSGKDRFGDILVNGERDRIKLQVSQKYAQGGSESGEPGTSEDLNVTELSVSEKPGSYTYIVEGNRTNWTVSTTESSWLEVLPKYNSNEIEVKVTENTVPEKREAHIYLSAESGEVFQEYLLTQSGILYDVLPYYGFLAAGEEVSVWEQERGSSVINRPDGLFNMSKWGFSTVSPRFGTITYEIPDNQYSKAIIIANDVNLFSSEKERNVTIQFLKDNGYVEDETRELTFFNKENAVEAQLVFQLGVRSEVHYTYKPVQEVEYPTFPVFPWYFVTDNTSFAKSFEEVQKWEKEHGGTYNPAFDETSTSTVIRKFEVDDEIVLQRWYQFYNSVQTDGSNFRNLVVILRDLNHVLWEHKGGFFVTNEFKALLDKEGFVYGYTVDYMQVYQNTAKRLLMGITTAQVGGKDVAVITFEKG